MLVTRGRGSRYLNWGWIILRVLVGLSLVTVLFLSQRFWYRAIWRVTSHWGRRWLRVGVRLMYLAGLLGIILTIADSLRQDHGRLLPNHSPVASFTGLWFASALFAYLAVKAVHAIEWLWHRFRKPAPKDPSQLRRCTACDRGRFRARSLAPHLLPHCQRRGRGRAVSRRDVWLCRRTPALRSSPHRNSHHQSALRNWMAWRSSSSATSI